MFYYVPRPLIDQTPWNDAIFLTTCTYTMHTCISDARIYIYIYTHVYIYIYTCVYIYIYILASLMQVCIVYVHVVKKIASFQGVWSINGRGT